MIVGTILGGTGIAVMNLIMPALAKKRFGVQRMGMVMGVYVLMLGVGAVLGASASFPLFQWMGADTAAAFHLLGLRALPVILAWCSGCHNWRTSRLPPGRTTAPPRRSMCIKIARSGR